MYTRTTRTLAYSEIPAALRDALVARAEKEELTDLAAQARVCGCTESRRDNKPGFFARLMGDKRWVVTQVVVLTPQWLLCANETNLGEVLGLAWRLDRIEARTRVLEAVSQRGVEITEGRGPRRSTYGLWLGDEPAARELEQAILDAVKQAAR